MAAVLERKKTHKLAARFVFRNSNKNVFTFKCVPGMFQTAERNTVCTSFCLIFPTNKNVIHQNNLKGTKMLVMALKMITQCIHSFSADVDRGNADERMCTVQPGMFAAALHRS